MILLTSTRPIRVAAATPTRLDDFICLINRILNRPRSIRRRILLHPVVIEHQVLIVRKLKSTGVVGKLSLMKIQGYSIIVARSHFWVVVVSKKAWKHLFVFFLLNYQTECLWHTYKKTSMAPAKEQGELPVKEQEASKVMLSRSAA